MKAETLLAFLKYISNESMKEKSSCILIEIKFQRQKLLAFYMMHVIFEVHNSVLIRFQCET